MRRKDDRKAIVETIKQAAAIYKKALVGKTFLFVFDGRAIEVLFRSDAFKHMTGVESTLPAKAFYKAAVKRTLQANQISFTPRHPYELAEKKTRHLTNMARLMHSDCYMLEHIVTQTETFLFGATESTFTLCLGLPDDTATETCYIVKSLRDGNASQKAEAVFPITHIFSKSNSEHLYHTCCYKSQSMKQAVLPPHIAARLSETLKLQLLYSNFPAYEKIRK